MIDKEHAKLMGGGLYKIELENRTVFYVPETTFDTVFQLLAEANSCKQCKQRYNDNHPEVVKAYCSDCFHKLAGMFSYEFLGVVRQEEDEREPTYGWLSPRSGTVFITSPSDSLGSLGHNEESPLDTLRYHGFFFPKYIVPEGEEERWYTAGERLRLYGTVKVNRTMLVRVWSTLYNASNDRKEAWYAIEKNGSYRQLSWKRGEGRKLYLAALADVKKTKVKYVAYQHEHLVWERIERLLQEEKV